MTPTIQAHARRCLALQGEWQEFEDARDALYDAIIREIERGCEDQHKDISQLVLFDTDVYKVRGIQTPSDQQVMSRILKGEAFLRQETARALQEGNLKALDNARAILPVLDRLDALRRWIYRPISMFDIVGDPPTVQINAVRHPSELKIAS